MSKSTTSFWCDLFDKVESMLLWVVFKHNNRRQKCTAYEALFFYQVLTLHCEMILTHKMHESDDEHDECFTDLWGTVENKMDSACHFVVEKTAEVLLDVAREKDLKRRISQRKIVKAFNWYVRKHGNVPYKCYNCEHIGVAHLDVEKRYRTCIKCQHWYLMPIEKNVDYKETMTAAYISGFFEWCGIKNEKAKSIMDIWKLRMSMKIFNEADGDYVRFFGNHVVSSEDSQEYCLCLERFEAGSVVKLLPCGHLMHSACLKDHIINSDVRAHDPKKRPRCWICRKPLMKVRDPGKSNKKKRRALEDV